MTVLQFIIAMIMVFTLSTLVIIKRRVRRKQDALTEAWEKQFTKYISTSSRRRRSSYGSESLGKQTTCT